MEALLRVSNLLHSFDYPLFHDLNFTLEKQKSMSITGISGSGKSTLLHICSTLLKPKNGEVFISGKDIYNLQNSELIKIRRNEIGIIFQSHFLFKGFSVKENMEIATILAKTNFDKNLIEQLGIAHILKQKPGDISGGQQQRVSLARVLSKKPKIIFADEPTGNLDIATAGEVTALLFDYIKANNAALFLVTHDFNLAKCCDMAYKLENLELKPL
ncbi:MAG: ATP-binding cassette domain-containing protein [Campylobacteraceae bacterium]|jgi:putative ABC transport system ATP-binding protein|nr:ATP-binding cassette domain-containing protein [Campylobacteraceae bacterium]